jgi:hypothetical protein
MPAESKKQRKAAGMALAAKRGEISPNELMGAAKQMYESMSEEQLRDFAKTEEKKLPEKVGVKKKKRVDTRVSSQVI